MKKTIILICTSIALILPNNMLGLIRKSREFGTQGMYYSTFYIQNSPDWCVYATMALINPTKQQCEYAENYRLWTFERRGIINPFPMTCCQSSIGCGGIPRKEIPEFWNREMHDDKTGLTALQLEFTIGNYINEPELPCLAVLSLRENGNTAHHAVAICYVKITEETINSTTTEYYVEYYDPWDGTLKQYSTINNPGIIQQIDVLH